MVLQLSFSKKILFKKLSNLSLQILLLTCLYLQIVFLQLYKVYNGILFAFYLSVLILYSIITMVNCFILLNFIKNINNIDNSVSFEIFEAQNCLIRSKTKNVLYILLFIFDSVLGITFYGSGVIDELKIFEIIQLFLITGIPFIIIFSILLLITFNLSINIGYYLNRVRDYIDPVEEIVQTENEIQQERQLRNAEHINHNINYNINIIIPSQVANEIIRKVEIIDNNILCSICLDNNYMNKDWSELICKHNYHSICIQKWLSNNSTCPLCRKDILENI